MIEFRREPPDLAAFARAVDASVKGASLDYAAHREGDVQMGLPVVTPVPVGI